MLTEETQQALTGSARYGVGLLLILSLGTLGCAGSGASGVPPGPATLRIGFGLTAGTSPEIGIQQTARNIALEGLVGVRRDGRSVPVLAERWSVSDDGLVWRVHLRSSAAFHSGKPADAQSIRQILQKQLPGALGPAIDDIAEIRAVADHERRSAAQGWSERRHGLGLCGGESYNECAIEDSSGDCSGRPLEKIGHGRSSRGV